MAITVAIVDGTNRLFWDSLRRALRRTDQLRVVRIRSPRSIERLLSRVQPDTLVIEVSDDSSDAEFEYYLSRYPDLTILGIHVESADMIVRMRNIGLERVVSLICGVSSDNAEAAEVSEHSRLRLIRLRDISRLLAAEGPPGSQADEGQARQSGPSVRCRARTGGHPFADALRWIDLCLHQRLAQEDAMDEHGAAPGWSMTTRRAEALLGDEFAGRSAAELRRSRRILEQTVFEDDAGSPLVTACDMFGLNRQEREVLLMTLAPELDSGYARVFGFLNDDLTRQRPTAGLLAQLLFDETAIAWDVRGLFQDNARLAHYGLIALDPRDALPGSQAAILPAEELVVYLLADREQVPQYAGCISVVSFDSGPPTCDASTAELRARLRSLREIAWVPPEHATIVQFIGEASALRWFERGALESGSALVRFELAQVDVAEAGGLRAAGLAAARVARLHGATLLVTGREALPPSQREFFDGWLLDALGQRVSHVVVHGVRPWVLQARYPVRIIEAPQGTAARAALWSDRARAFRLALSPEVAHRLAARVRFGEPEIDAVLGTWGEVEPTRDELLATVRRVARVNVPPSVRVVETSYTWDDIVLTAELRAELQQIPVHIRQATRVLDEWGYRTRLPYGDGVAALFSGPSGTGKTMAAHIIASELGVDVFQVDLSKTLSKWIGESEQNLDAVFAAAERAGAVLLFDEADALFGKRTEVRDAHDRYANIEVSYLLQRMEAFSGLAVLTTNMRQNLDKAFMRRLRFDCAFRAPGPREREAIWQRVFPSDAPLAKDVSFTYFARLLELTGGSIQQIATRAAFLAAEEGESIEMAHIIRATREELRKLGMVSEEKSLKALAA